MAEFKITRTDWNEETPEHRCSVEQTAKEGHIQRMNLGRLAGRTEEVHDARCRRRGQLRWRDCMKRNLEKAGVNNRVWEIETGRREGGH